MFKIQILNTIAPIGLNQFPQDLYHIGADIENADAILVRSANMHDLTIPDSVQVVGRAGAGVNNIPVAALTKRGIPVFNTPGANANAVCELVIAGLLLASRNICQAWNYVNDLQLSGHELEKEIEQNKKRFVGFELMGKTIGIIGLGSIGVKVANAAISLGMRVIGYDPTISVTRAWELSSQVQQAHHLEELLATADFISIHVPLVPDTKHMLNASRFQLLKKGAVLLNFARDEIIDNQALQQALNENHLHAYVSDFPSASLKNHPRVINLPHLGASTKEAEENCAAMIAKQVRDYLEFGSISHSVNFPSVDVSHFQHGSRLAIVNANVPSMVAQISGFLAAAGLNIASLVNKSRDEIAYTLIDINDEVKESVLAEIRNIQGVLKCRILRPLFKQKVVNRETIEQLKPALDIA